MAGFIAQRAATLTGTVFIDSNGNGIFDTGEAVLPGIVVSLTGTTSDNQAVTASVTSDANGLFTISNMLPGTYNLSADGGANFVNGNMVFGSLSTPEGVDAISGIQLAAGQTITGTIGFRGLAPGAINLSQFLADSTASDLPIPAAGSGSGQPSIPDDVTPVVSTAIPDISVGKNSLLHPH